MENQTGSAINMLNRVLYGVAVAGFGTALLASPWFWGPALATAAISSEAVVGTAAIAGAATTAVTDGTEYNRVSNWMNSSSLQATPAQGTAPSSGAAPKPSVGSSTNGQVW